MPNPQVYDYPVRCLFDLKNTVGESPVWSVREGVLYWVDIIPGTVFRWQPGNAAATAPQSRTFGETIGSIGLREAGGLLLAMKSGVKLIDDWLHDTPRLLVDPEPELAASNRLNDGKTSPEGRFWVGTMDDRPQEKASIAHLYQIDPDGRSTRRISGLKISNGLAWSPDGRVLYHADSRGGAIWKYRYDPASGAIGPREVLAAMQPGWGRPDGGAVDAEGCYWSCGIDASRINRFSPSGELLGYLPLPVTHPTMPCFGGPDLKTLYVTSLSHHFKPEQYAATPLAGALFEVQMPLAGTPVGLFKG